MITNIYITIDTEYSIAGAFDPHHYFSPLADEVVYGNEPNAKGGLSFLLDTFEQYEIEATFFVEAINVKHFGYNKMGDVVKEIRNKRQDVQLHVHPVWAVFNGSNYTANDQFYPLNDTLLGRSEDQIKRILDIGFDAFDRWGVDCPRAIRTGSLFIEDNLYRIFSDYGIDVSSSVGTGVYLPNSKRLHLDVVGKMVEGVFELPVTTFYDLPLLRPNNRKSLQITSCSWPEIKHTIVQANKNGVEDIVILTHPFEFFKRKDFRYSETIRNRVNQKRLIKLCKFIQNNQDRFMSKHIVDIDTKKLSTQKKHDMERIKLGPKTPTFALLRKVQNKINDSIWGY